MLGAQTGGISGGKKIGLLALIIFGLGSLLVMWCGLMYFLFSGMKLVGMLETGLFLPFFAGMIVVLLFCVVGVIGILFQSKDMEFLASLPLSGGTVFAAKFALVYFSELLVTLALVYPAIVIYGIVAEMGALFYVSALVVTLILPMIPLAVATLLSLVLMRFSGLSKHREKFVMIIGIALTLTLVIGQQVFSAQMNMSGGFNEQDIANLLEENSGLLDVVGRSFPPAMWAAKAAAGGSGSLASWGLYVLSSLAALALTVFVGAKLFLSGALARLESSKRGKKAGLKRDSMRSGSAVFAIMKNEVRTVMRSSVFAMNSVIGVLLFPVMIAIMAVSMTMQIGAAADMNTAIAMLGEFADSVNPTIIFGVALIAGVFVCLSNMTASTTFSREGKNFWLVKSLPVSYREQAYGRLLFGIIVNALTIILSVIALAVIVPAAAVTLSLAAVCAIAGSVCPIALGMIVDMRKPKLNWQSEAEAIKQNFNGFLGMLLSMGYAIVFCVPLMLLSFILPNIWVAALVALAAMGMSSFVAVMALGKSAEKLLGRI